MKFEMVTGCDRGLCRRGCGRQNMQLNTYDYLADVPGNVESTDLVEVQFKNTRKGYYHNVNHLDLKKGDVVAVEANPGHDIGVVTLTGQLVKLQVKKANLKSAEEIRRIYRIAKPVDIDKYNEAKSREHGTMIQSRQIAKDLGLQMKIGDVEYQGDGNKAIFYYIADERVDFRQLIKVLAETFHVRIEMKQIGARQEAGLIGGIGVCGQALCCSRYINDFQSITTAAARCQDLSLNPQKLAGQCGKLKCCINYEAAVYLDAKEKLPHLNGPLHLEDGDIRPVKADALKGIMWFTYTDRESDEAYPLKLEKVREIMALNAEGKNGEAISGTKKEKIIDFKSAAGEDSITRFDEVHRKKKGKPRGKMRRRNDSQQK